MSENELLLSYQKDFFSKTGKGLDIRVISKYQSLCKLPKRIDMDSLIDLILSYTKWTKKDITSRNRHEQFIFKKHLIYYILYHNGHNTLKISRYFNIYHSTVLNGLRKFGDRLDTQESTVTTFKNICSFITSNFDK